MRLLLKFIVLFFLLASTGVVFGQQKNGEPIIAATIDTVSAGKSNKDTLPKKVRLAPEPHSARKATMRSAILPGWGQAYNKEYWKIPIVYAAIGVTVGFFIDNNTWYNRTRDAYIIRFTKDTMNFGKIHPTLTNIGADDLRYYRNEFRRNRDYSVVAILVAWGLNVVDATVFGHLKEFDVSEDLSLKINPSYNPINKQAAFGLVLSPKAPARKPVLPAW